MTPCSFDLLHAPNFSRKLDQKLLSTMLPAFESRIMHLKNTIFVSNQKRMNICHKFTFLVLIPSTCLVSLEFTNLPENIPPARHQSATNQLTGSCSSSGDKPASSTHHCIHDSDVHDPTAPPHTHTHTPVMNKLLCLSHQSVS